MISRSRRVKFAWGEEVFAIGYASPWLFYDMLFI